MVVARPFAASCYAMRWQPSRAVASKRLRRCENAFRLVEALELRGLRRRCCLVGTMDEVFAEGLALAD